MSSFLSLVIGLFLGILLGFVRAFFNNNDIDERKKLRRTRNFFKKKSMESFRDRRITGTIMLLMLVAAPFYFGYKSQQPVFFGRYSAQMMVINFSYLTIFISTNYLFLTTKKHN